MENESPPRLSDLIAALTVGPPAIGHLSILLNYTEDYTKFTDMIKATMPDELSSITSASGTYEQLRTFFSAFREKYFPIMEGSIEYYMEDAEESPYKWLLHAIPFELYGFGYDERHDIWNQYNPDLAVFSLLSRPTPPDFYKEESVSWINHETETDEIHVAWMEKAAGHIPKETLLRVPKHGVPVGLLDQALTGTRFAAAASAGAWIWNETDNFFLDASYDDGIEIIDPWDMETIEIASVEWRKAKKLMDSVDKLSQWLSSDVPGRFAEMLDFILERLDAQEKKEKTQ